MAYRQGRGKQRPREEGGDDSGVERYGAVDWSQMEPYEAGEPKDMPKEEREIFGELAHELLEGAPQEATPASNENASMRLRGAGPDAMTGPSPVGRIAGRQGRSSQDLTYQGAPSGNNDLQDVCGDATSAGQTSGVSRGESSEGLSYDSFLWGFLNRVSGEITLSGAAPSSSTAAAEYDSQQPRQRHEGAPSPKKRGKKKLPVPDLDAINDPEERRRQRRLVKNRNTAAASRERKQKEFDELAARTRALEEDNANLRQRIGHQNFEIQQLNREIAQAASSNAIAAGSAHGGSSAADEGGGGNARGMSQPLISSGDGRGRGLSASVYSPMGRSGYIQGVDGQFLYLRPGAEQPNPGQPNPEQVIPGQIDPRQPNFGQVILGQPGQPLRGQSGRPQLWGAEGLQQQQNVSQGTAPAIFRGQPQQGYRPQDFAQGREAHAPLGAGLQGFGTGRGAMQGVGQAPTHPSVMRGNAREGEEGLEGAQNPAAGDTMGSRRGGATRRLGQRGRY